MRPPFAPPEPDSGAVTVVRVIVPAAEAEPAGARAQAITERAAPTETSGPLEAVEVGGDDAFILAWGRGHEALRSRSRQLVLSMLLNACLAASVGFLAWRNEQKETYVFVRDSLGNVVQANARGFLHAGDRRSEVEVKGFVRRWVTDAFTWTPLDVEDRLRAALRVVDGRAQGVVKGGLRLAERRTLVDNGTSGRVWDDARTPSSATSSTRAAARRRPAGSLRG
jgi:hypothetical protein